MRAELKWEPRDVWVGVFWEHPYHNAEGIVHECYICLIPCLPIHVTWTKRVKR